MVEIKNVLVAGTGAIGLMIAGRIFDSGKADIFILAKDERAQRYKNKGLHINDKSYDFKMLATSQSLDKNIDLIIIACKHYSLDTVIEDIEAFVTQDTIILSLLNGITSEEIIGKRYGVHRIPLAMSSGSDSQRSGTSVRYTHIGKIHFGDKDALQTKRDDLLKKFFSDCDMPFTYHQNDMLRTLWYKFMMNVGINQTQALLGLGYGAFKKGGNNANIYAMQIMEKLMNEAIAVAACNGIILDNNDIEECYRVFNTLDDNSYTSMCQDIFAKRKTEVEIFAESVCAMGKAYNIQTPANDFMCLAIHALEHT
ncbi:MAG: 2-dehydropantoate 2-reductase [Termitinemataceae bacterium]|nr:MAG: 2-dehydropantoate 2-reductase [Termitinemataceae bacterium]